MVRRRKLPPPAACRVYELTEWGEELEPVIVRLGRWGARSPSKPYDAALGVDSLILSFRGCSTRAPRTASKRALRA